ncbi:MAG: transglycosylase domain-containing protein [Tannerellaceae bacterium]|jgi:hypothetical protein|nr:transglycosylase domain-containing protein [Tannerellaceae bacterium]
MKRFNVEGRAGKNTIFGEFFPCMKKRRRRSRRRIKNFFTSAIITLLAVACLWLVVTFAARRYAMRKLQAIEKQYNFDIRYRSVSLTGYNKLRIEGFTVAANRSSLLLYAQSFVIKANLWNSSFSREDIEGFEIEQLHIRYNPPAKRAGGTTDYASCIEQALEKTASLFPYLPPDVWVHDIHISYQEKKDVEHTFYIPQLRMTGHRFVAEMQDADDERRTWICGGTYQTNPARLSLRMYAKQPGKVTLPWVTDYTGATVRFDTLAIDLKAKRNPDGVEVIQGKAGVKGLSLHHASLSSDTLQVGKGYINYRLFAGRDFLELDSSATTVRYNRLRFNPFVRIEKNRKWRVRLALDTNEFPADDLFTSLPRGAFGNLEGLRVSGTLAWHVLLDVDMARVPDLVFESVVRPRNFSIVNYGHTDLRKMSRPFLHVIRDGNQIVRHFEVSSRNPAFRPIHTISRYLPMTIMHGEDFAFYHHRGFYPQAFHKSLVENIESGRFLRGASTLTMQVVKNVFLNADKTLARKLEEILIVWLIEDNRLTSKSRMMEVYMNIIEWGPNVYGITEAARFYFAKDPSALTLSECIFLAYIIPYPKYLRSHFNGLRPKPAYYEFFHDAVRRLLQRQAITPDEAARTHPDLAFRGPVIEYLTR